MTQRRLPGNSEVTRSRLVIQVWRQNKLMPRLTPLGSHQTPTCESLLANAVLARMAISMKVFGAASRACRI
jgi:hypothetical protein